jgi:integrase
MPTTQETKFELLAKESIAHLSHQHKILYAEFRSEFIQWLREKGKEPKKHVGYKESNIRPLARRVHQVFEYAWSHDKAVLDITPDLADQFLEDLQCDKVTTKNDEKYADSSKKKFKSGIQAYFRFTGQEWDPSVSFTESVPELPSDPLTQEERKKLLSAALEYQSPPSYSNLSPEERDRWKTQIAQIIGKPKEKVSPDDWDSLQRSWKIPSLVAVALDGGLRAALVTRLQISCVDIDNQQINVPASMAVKNEKKWIIDLTDRTTQMLRRWMVERKNNSHYDDSESLWLNRQGNPYNSGSLNNLLSNLLDEAEINADGRKLTWHSIRHSTGMYVYAQERDLELVAEILRHKSLESARRYAHPTPEAKKDVLEGIQRGGYL